MVKMTAWYGGDCPVDPCCKVEIECRNQRFHTVIAGDWGWGHLQDGLDIVAYRKLQSRTKVEPDAS